MSSVVSLNMAYPFGGSTASVGIYFIPRIRRFSYLANPQLPIMIPRSLHRVASNLRLTLLD
jgi:hypothetical protein